MMPVHNWPTNQDHKLRFQDGLLSSFVGKLGLVQTIVWPVQRRKAEKEIKEATYKGRGEQTKRFVCLRLPRVVIIVAICIASSVYRTEQSKGPSTLKGEE